MDIVSADVGAQSKLATHTVTKRSVVKGQPLRFLAGHNTRSAPALRFWSKVDKTSDCWEWTGSKNSKGYGQLNINGEPVLAHRLSWEMAFGKIPVGTGYHGECVLHKCDNPGCVNPAHLFLGTNLDNVSDMISKGRKVILKGSQLSTKLSDDQVRNIRSNRGISSQRELAREYGVSKSTINSIQMGGTWKHLI